MQPYILKGKNALVTGAARRIGKDISLTLATEGVNVILHHRNSSKDTEALASDLKGLGVNAWVIRADFEKPGEYEKVISGARFACGSNIDILINSASIFPEGTAGDLEWPELSRNMLVNAWVPFYLGRELAAQSEDGVIINLLDSRIKDSHDPSHTAYIISKKLLESLTLIMARELAPKIRVNAVAPGLILPPPGKDASYLENLTGSVPLKRHGNAEDVAQAVLMLVRNAFITGETVFVDGGASL
ncbi:MAG: SDR family oxidoreductase [Brevinematales bacterium]|jgi:NAD(P)-dependent dehydrogenase (short-subunit alcohol dehydrogenase family)